ncbi:bifunctional phosphoglucose/phosphomannose isomerase [Patescibacteria group bacterium]|nr:bifunctional phosphoglucose/phosphomannose isomerase [Patescibacteria group bacterium]
MNEFDTSLDTLNYYQSIKEFPDQFVNIDSALEGKKVDGTFDNVIICGMGGSSMAFDLLKGYFHSHDIDVPMYVSRTYSLPKEASKRSLVFISSYSGNTEEPLACMDEAEEKNLTIVGFSSGGQVEERCKKAKHLHIRFPDEPAYFQPRLGIGYSFSAMLFLLMQSGLIPENIKEVHSLAEFLKNISFEEEAKKTALVIGDTVPIMYTTDEFLNTVARIVKIKFNENSKMPAFYNAFPELNHNEMVGFTQYADRFHFIFFRDQSAFARINKRMDITKSLLLQRKAHVTEIEMKGETFLEKMFSSLHFGDYVTYYRALLNGIDPTPVAMVEDFKDMMKE